MLTIICFKQLWRIRFVWINLSWCLPKRTVQGAAFKKLLLKRSVSLGTGFLLTIVKVEVALAARIRRLHSQKLMRKLQQISTKPSTCKKFTQGVGTVTMAESHLSTKYTGVLSLSRTQALLSEDNLTPLAYWRTIKIYTLSVKPIQSNLMHFKTW